MADAGIDDDFVRQVRQEVSPGTSALFVLTTDAVPDKVREAFVDSGLHARLIHTNLTHEQETALREAFAEEAVAS